MKKTTALLAATASLFSTGVIAGTMGSCCDTTPDKTWFATLSGGAAWAEGGETQTLALTPTIRKTYVADKSWNSLAIGEIFAGLQNQMSDDWVGRIGLAVATTGNAKMQGIIWDDANSLFDNYSYNYAVNNTRISLKGQLLWDCGYTVMPWISGSAGVGFNRAKDFTNTPLIFEAVPNPNFADNTETAFTYTLGAGFQVEINENWQMGLGYEFADWGKSELGRASGQTQGTGLTMDHLYTNGVLINITYVA